MNGTEYLEHLFASGIADLPALQPIRQKKIWDKMKPEGGPDKLAKVIEECFPIEGRSWTNNISWVRGYERLLGPMEKGASATRCCT